MTVRPTLKANLFSQEELKLLYKCIDSQFYEKPREDSHILEMVETGWENKVKVEKDVGKASTELQPLPEEISNKLIAYAAEFGFTVQKEQIVALFMRYSNEFGLPTLEPHLDIHNCGLSIDYLVRSNVDWPVVMENEEFHLKDNEGIFFEASAVVHWRNPMVLDDEDYIEIIIFHYLVPSIEDLTPEQKEKRVAPYKNAWN